MTSETPADSGPENDTYEGYSVDADDQLTPEDTLETRDVDDELERGYSPPESYSAAQGFGNTPYEEEQGETLDQRLAQEVPEPDPYVAAETEDLDNMDDNEVGDARAGRLVAPDQGAGEDTESDLVGEDVGIDGAASSAEEAAVHIVEEEWAEDDADLS